MTCNGPKPSPLRPASHVAADLEARLGDNLSIEAARVIRDQEETIEKLSRVISKLLDGSRSRN
ncbi:MAG: hypothetical protein WD066_08520 [Planctomycetaceae bacterium]